MSVNYGDYEIVEDGESCSLRERLYLWNDEGDRDRLLHLLLVKGLQSGSITADDLHDIGFLSEGQTLVRKIKK